MLAKLRLAGLLLIGIFNKNFTRSREEIADHFINS